MAPKTSKTSKTSKTPITDSNIQDSTKDLVAQIKSKQAELNALSKKLQELQKQCKHETRTITDDKKNKNHYRFYCPICKLDFTDYTFA